jgi:tetratricopeptide (TPR) repeat protein
LPAVTSRLGGFYSESGTPERGRSLLNQAIPMLRTPALSNPVELAYACNLLGMLDLRAGDYKAGEASLREAVSVATDALGDSHPDTAIYEANLALALYNEGHYDRAEILLNRARHIVETRLPADNFRLGRILADLTNVETALGQFARAETDGEQSLAILSRWREPASAEIAIENVTLATVYLRERKIAEAEKILPGAVALERRLSDDPHMPDRRILADGIQKLGELRALEHNWHDAQKLFSEAIAIYASTLGPSHPLMAPVLLEYAAVLKHCGAPKAEVKDIEARARSIKTT